VKRIDASRLKITSRLGEPPFQLVLQEKIIRLKNRPTSIR